MTAEESRVRAALEGTADDLLRYLERRVRVAEEAADLLGETMLHAWRRAEAGPRDPERQRMWLFTIAANVLAQPPAQSLTPSTARTRYAAARSALREALAEAGAVT